jgi:hypothetical protein
MNKKKKLLQIAIYWLLFVKAVFLFIAGISFFIRNVDSSNLTISQTTIVMILMLIDSVVHLIFIWLLRKRKTLIYYLAILFLIGDVILTITDQMGTIDYVYLTTNIILISLITIYPKKENL